MSHRTDGIPLGPGNALELIDGVSLTSAVIARAR
jgi:hypothetical protein